MHYIFVTFAFIKQLSCTVKDVTKDAVIYFIFFVIRFLYACNISIVKPHLTTQISSNCGRREPICLIDIAHNLLVFHDRFLDTLQWILRCIEVLKMNILSTFNHQLQHKATHFACCCLTCCFIIG